MLWLDLLRLDREVAELARRHRRFLAELRRSPAEDHSFELLPRGVDDELLHELSNREALDPLAAPIRRWLGHLLVEQGRLGETRAVANALFRERHGVHRPESGRYTSAELRARALSDALRADEWLGAWAGPASSVASQHTRSSERRAELCEKLAPWELPSAARVQRGERLARELLDTTKDAYAELGATRFGQLIPVALGALVPGDFPSQLNARTLANLVSEGGWFDGLDPEPFEAPARLGASSVLRGLFGIGSALHDAGAPSRQPFTLRHEPSGLRRRAYGALFSLIPSHPPFAERRLGVGRQRMRDYLRHLGRVLLVGAREAALRALLHGGLPSSPAVDPERFREYSALALGFEADGALSGALFWSEHALVSFEALLLAAARAARLVEVHDDDWFRNPRAAQDCRAEFETPPPDSAETSELEAGLAALTRSVLHSL